MNCSIDISNVVLKTDRLTLRSWKQSDASDFYEYAKVEGVGEMAGWPHHKNIESTIKTIDYFIKEKCVFALEHKGKVIGSVGIEKYNEAALPELDDKKARAIGFVLSKEYWGKGLMSEAVNEVIKYLFENVKVDVVVCEYYSSNVRSAKLQERCGFKLFKKYKTLTRLGTQEEVVANIRTSI